MLEVLHWHPSNPVVPFCFEPTTDVSAVSVTVTQNNFDRVVCGKRTKQTLTTATVLSIIQYDLSRCCMPFDNDTDNDMVDQHIHLAQALSLSLGRIPGSQYESGYRG